MKPAKKVKWGIIGCGDVTEIKSGPALQLIKNSKLVAVMRRDAAKAKDYAGRHGVKNHYSNANQLINDHEVNAVYIATPPSTHKQYSIMALQAQKPVYVEKPMALTHSDCLQMIEVSNQTNTPLFVAYYRRALPSFLKVKEIIESGKIGKVNFVNLQLYRNIPEKNFVKNNKPFWRFDPDISGGGLLYDLGSHQINYLHYLFGKVQNISTLGINQNNFHLTEDAAVLSMIFQSGVLCTCSWCFTTPKELEKDTIEIIGEKGKIEFSTFNFSPIKVFYQKGLKEYNFPKPKHVQQPLLTTIVNELLGTGKCPSSKESAAYTSMILDQISKNINSQN